MNKQSLLTMNDLSTDVIMSILEDAKAFSNSKKDWQLSKSYLVANLFFEPSTRTHYSFMAAEHRLGCSVVDFNDEVSSIQKGETLNDTVKTLEAMGYDALVIRHPENEYFKQLEDVNVPIINGGDGSGNHPSQCLLDMLTIYQEFGTFEGLNIAIIGDIDHSRVAKSNQEALLRFGANVKCSGPKKWVKEHIVDYMDMDEIIHWADVVMLLRIQHERHDTSMKMSRDVYLERHGLTKQRFDMMKSKAIIMHPSPVNRGVEIADELVESEKSRIFKQVENGLHVRKAMMKYVFSEEF